MRHRGNIRILILLMTMMVLVAGCGPDPRKEAAAYATRAEADRQTAAAEQLRQQSDELHALNMQEKQIQIETRQATAESWRRGWNTMLTISFWFATAAVCYSLFMSARTLNNTLEGVGEAIVVRAQLRANLIPLDYKTRQYPLLRHVHGSRFLLSNPNDGSVSVLDAEHPADRQKIAAMGAVQLSGAIAVEARKSSDPASIAIMQPTVIDALEGELVTGAQLMREMASLAGAGWKGAGSDDPAIYEGRSRDE